MKLLLCHNYYQQPGGEDRVFAAERALLESHGHTVVTFTKHNDTLREMSSLGTARATFWNRTTYRELQQLIRRERPDLMHCTNLFPLISPAAYDAAHDSGLPVVQSLHNYRLLCPQAQLVRNDRVCERCLGKCFPWPGVWHACYRGSTRASAVVAAMLAWHRLRGTWLDGVDQYIALTEFARDKYVAGGLPSKKLAVKPNFLPVDPGPGRGSGAYAVFVGRLSPEKGVRTLLDAWRRLGGQIPLKILGDGPLATQVQEAAAQDSAMQWLGQRTWNDVLGVIGEARFLILPSLGYETFGLSIIEAYAKGTPVVVSRLGAVAELVDHGRTGWHVTPGDASDLAESVQRLWGDEATLCRYRGQARQEFESKYTADRNYKQLVTLYERVLRTSHAGLDAVANH